MSRILSAILIIRYARPARAFRAGHKRMEKTPENLYNSGKRNAILHKEVTAAEQGRFVTLMKFTGESQ